MNYWLYALFCIFLASVLLFSFVKGANKSYYWWGYSPLLYAVLWTGGSLIVIEYGFYITEQGAHSHFTGAAFYYFIYSGFFFFGVEVCNRFPNRMAVRQAQPTNMTTAKLILVIVLVVQSLLLINAILSPKSWFNPDIDRWNFWDNSRFPSLRLVLGTTAFPFFFLSSILYCYYKKSGQRLLGRITLIGSLMHLAFLFLQGQKYSGFIVCAFAYFIPYLIMMKVRIDTSLFKNIKLVVTVGVVVSLLLLMVVVWFANSWTGSRLAMSPLQNAAYRVFVLQGHVFWGVDYLMTTRDISKDEAWDLFWETDGSGVSTLMQLVGDPQLVANYQDRGVRYATVHPSLVIILFGPVVTVFLQFTLGILVCWVVRCLVYGIESCNVLIGFGALNSLICLFGIFMMSEIALFLSLKFIGPLVVMVISLVSVKHHLPKE